MKDKLDFKEIKKLTDFMEERNLSEFELEVDGFKIRLSKKPPNSQLVDSLQMMAAQQNNGPSDTQQIQAVDQPSPEDNRHYILSPMVGTFYRSPDPSSPPFVDIGETVKKNQTLCIIEAMKLMNEIESDVDGKIEEILVENGKAIEYGQQLFAIKAQ
jgi:acetyl-CoA carboxylase biotin carboxyl carrier protein